MKTTAKQDAKALVLSFLLTQIKGVEEHGHERGGEYANQLIEQLHKLIHLMSS